MSIYYCKEAEIGFNPKTNWAQTLVLKLQFLNGSSLYLSVCNLHGNYMSYMALNMREKIYIILLIL